jgi:hypothetical protein
MSRVGFDPTMSVGKRPHTYAFDPAATGIGILFLTKYIYKINIPFVIVLLINLFNITTGCYPLIKLMLFYSGPI